MPSEIEEIAEALAIGRTESMQKSGTDKPRGKRYEKAIGEWLRTHSFRGIDKEGGGLAVD